MFKKKNNLIVLTRVLCFPQIHGPCKCSSIVSVFIRHHLFGISKQANTSFAFVKLLNSSGFPVAISMANSTTTVMKVMTPGPAGRSSPEGSQVSLKLVQI